MDTRKALGLAAAAAAGYLVYRYFSKPSPSQETPSVTPPDYEYQPVVTEPPETPPPQDCMSECIAKNGSPETCSRICYSDDPANCYAQCVNYGGDPAACRQYCGLVSQPEPVQTPEADCYTGCVAAGNPEWECYEKCCAPPSGPSEPSPPSGGVSGNLTVNATVDCDCGSWPPQAVLNVSAVGTVKKTTYESALARIVYELSWECCGRTWKAGGFNGSGIAAEESLPYGDAQATLRWSDRFTFQCDPTDPTFWTRSATLRVRLTLFDGYTNKVLAEKVVTLSPCYKAGCGSCSPPF